MLESSSALFSSDSIVWYSDECSVVSFSLDDISYYKMASHSSTMTGMYYDARYATDRNETTCMRTLDIGHYSPYIIVWWKVDLEEVYNIYSIDIMGKNYMGYGIYSCKHL